MLDLDTMSAAASGMSRAHGMSEDYRRTGSDFLALINELKAANAKIERYHWILKDSHRCLLKKRGIDCPVCHFLEIMEKEALEDTRGVKE